MSDHEKLGRGEYLVAALLLIALVGNCRGPAHAQSPQIEKPYDPQMERLQAEKLNRVKKFCKARPDCVQANLSYEQEFDEIMLRLQVPRDYLHGSYWVRLSPPTELISKATKIRKGLSYTQRTNLVEVNGNFILDAAPAVRQARETLWHYWIDYDSECWLVGEDVPNTDLYACYDYGQRVLLEKTRVEK